MNRWAIFIRPQGRPALWDKTLKAKREVYLFAGFRKTKLPYYANLTCQNGEKMENLVILAANMFLKNN